MSSLEIISGMRYYASNCTFNYPYNYGSHIVMHMIPRNGTPSYDSHPMSNDWRNKFSVWFCYIRPPWEMIERTRTVYHFIPLSNKIKCQNLIPMATIFEWSNDWVPQWYVCTYVCMQNVCMYVCVYIQSYVILNIGKNTHINEGNPLSGPAWPLKYSLIYVSPSCHIGNRCSSLYILHTRISRPALRCTRTGRPSVLS